MASQLVGRDRELGVPDATLRADAALLPPWPGARTRLALVEEAPIP